MSPRIRGLFCKNMPENSKTIELIDSCSNRRFKLSGSAADRSVLEPIEKAAGIWEPHLVRLLHRLVRSDDVCLDVGANIGVHTLVLAGLAPQGRIHAFEPSSKNFSFLKRNIRDNHLGNVTAHQLGISDSSQPTARPPSEMGLGKVPSDIRR